MFHPGYIESCHTPRNAQWYKKEKCIKSFCKNIENGGYIPCGSSGNRPFMIIDNEVHTSRLNLYDFNIYCCCFIFGKECDEERLERRWSCCHKRLKGTMLDMLTLKGCEKITNYNVTK